MAVVQNPFLSTDARGSVSGLTASVTRGGKIIKKKARPSNRRGLRNMRTRSILGYLARTWGGLDDAQRASWGAWAINHPGTDKFGDPFIMSGFNAYIMLNFNAVRLSNGGNRQDLPPIAEVPTGVDVLTVATGATTEGDIDLTWTELGIGVPEDDWEVQMAGPFLSPGRVSVESLFSFKTSVAGGTLLVTVDALDLEMWFWFRVRYVDENGQTSAWEVGQATPKVGV